MGLLGSKYFAENMGIDPDKVNLMVNLDMVGRLREGNGLQVGGVGTAAGLAVTRVISFNDTTTAQPQFHRRGLRPFGPLLVLREGHSGACVHYRGSSRLSHSL
ncbi:MAG: M28 family peptidase [Marinilabiliales bacterium]|nr:M28 family peptidase [Marinilabiliales bacterium]